MGTHETVRGRGARRWEHSGRVHPQEPPNLLHRDPVPISGMPPGGGMDVSSADEVPDGLVRITRHLCQLDRGQVPETCPLLRREGPGDPGSGPADCRGPPTDPSYPRQSRVAGGVVGRGWALQSSVAHFCGSPFVAKKNARSLPVNSARATNWEADGSPFPFSHLLTFQRLTPHALATDSRERGPLAFRTLSGWNFCTRLSMHVYGYTVHGCTSMDISINHVQNCT